MNKAIRRVLYRWGNAPALCKEYEAEQQRLRALRYDTILYGETTQVESERERCKLLAAEYREMILESEQLEARERRFMRCIDALLFELTEEERLLIELRYRKRLRWAAVAQELHFSTDRVKHRDGELIEWLAQSATVTASVQSSCGRTNEQRCFPNFYEREG